MAAIWAALGTFWSIFAWYHQEVVVPATAPVNLTTEVAVQETGAGKIQAESTDQQLDAIQITVTANNVSTKPIHLLPNYWEALAANVEPPEPDTNGSAWLDEVNAAQALQYKNGQVRYALPGRFYHFSPFDLVAWGNLFPSSYVLQPKETVSASALFYVPKGKYDMVHVEVHILSTEKKDAALLIDVESKKFQYRYFHVARDNTRKEVTAKADIDGLKIQDTEAFREISLGNGAATHSTVAPGEAEVVPRPNP